jgi:hypothetical protein
MRGDEQHQQGFIVLTSREDHVPADHPSPPPARWLTPRSPR